MKKKIMVGILVGVALLILAAGGYLYWVYRQVYVGGGEERLLDPLVKWGEPTLMPTPTPTPDPLRSRNVLILGYAGGEHSGGALTDTMILVQVRPKERKAILISIPRDIWVPIPIKGEERKDFKLNAAYAIGNDDRKYPEKLSQYKGRAGGGNLAKDLVGEVMGVEVDHFVALSFEGFEKMIEILGGVEVWVPYAFEDKFYPIEGKEDDLCEKTEVEIGAVEATLSGHLLEHEFLCRFETIQFERGRQWMDGEMALKFVRSRHAEVGGGDFGRALRQQAFMKAIMDKIFSLGSVTKMIPLITTMARYVQTDIDLEAVINFLWEYAELTDMEIESVALTTENVLEEAKSADGQFILRPKGGGGWGAIHQFVGEEIERLVDS